MLDPKIQTFLAVIEQGSYTAAANTLHLTQPAVTQHIHKLEQHYGCQLIDSTRRAIKPTKAGELLYEYLSLQRANESRFTKLMTNVVEPLRIGATLSVTDYYLAKPLITYISEHSERVRVTTGNTPHLIEALQKGELDCGFIEGIFDTTLFETRVFRNAEFWAVVSAKHPLAKKEASLEELYPYPIALREPHSGTRDIFGNWLKKQNTGAQAFEQVFEMGSFVLIKELLKATNAVTFLYEGVVKKEIEEGSLVRLKLKGFNLNHPLVFAFRKGDPQAKRLIEFFNSVV